jgi:transposase
MISRDFGDRFVRNFDPTFERNEESVGVRRIEVITGAGGRRTWSAEDKARIVGETLRAGANVSAIARRCGLRPQQVYGWRRLARDGALEVSSEGAVGFVPIVATVGDAAVARPARPPRSGGIEIEIAGMVIRIAPGTDWRFVRDMLRAAKAAL